MRSPEDPNEPVVVAEVMTEVEAAIMRGALEGAGIRAWIVGGMTSGFRAEAPGRARLLVRGEDAARARAVLAGEAEPGQDAGGE